MSYYDTVSLLKKKSSHCCTTMAALSEKVQRALQIRTDSLALDALQDDTKEVRWAMERDALAQAKELQAAVAGLVSTVKTLRQGVAEVSATAQAIHQTAPNPQEADVALQVREALERRNQARERWTAIQTFLQQFNVSDRDRDLLENFHAFDDDPSQAMEFLQALERVQGIRRDPLGLTTLVDQQESAYERLYQWLLQHDFAEATELVVQALKLLPPSFQAWQVVGQQRRAHVTQRFLWALTDEARAHDAVAYVGDMLAWVFGAVSDEVEFVRAVLPEKVAASEADTSTLLEEETVTTPGELLTTSLSGLLRPLKLRILQVVQTLASREDEDDDDSDDGLDLDDEGTLVRTKLKELYEICGLLLFYKSAMEKAWKKVDQGDESPLLDCLKECLTEAATAYEATVRVYLSMLGELAASTGDSECRLVRSLVLLLADVRLNSPGYGAQVPCPVDCRVILSMDWVTETLLESAVAHSCRVLGDVLALKEALSTAKKSGVTVVVGEKLDEALEAKEEEVLQALVERETDQALAACGLAPLVSAWRRWKEVEAEDGSQMITYPGLGPDHVEGCLKEFYVSLYSPPLPSLEEVPDVALRRKTKKKIAEAVCELYTKLHESISSSGKGGYDDISFLSHSPSEVQTLFAA